MKDKDEENFRQAEVVIKNKREQTGELEIIVM